MIPVLSHDKNIIHFGFAFVMKLLPQKNQIFTTNISIRRVHISVSIQFERLIYANFGILCFSFLFLFNQHYSIMIAIKMSVFIKIGQLIDHFAVILTVSSTLCYKNFRPTLINQNQLTNHRNLRVEWRYHNNKT